MRVDGAADDAGGYDRGDRLRSGDPQQHAGGQEEGLVLSRSLTFVDGVGIIIGIMIGSGIFASAGTAITEAGSPGAALLAWIVAAVLVVMGSFCYGQLAVQMPSASGDAEYLRPC